MPKVSKSSPRRTSSRSRSTGSKSRRKSKSLLSQLGAINLFRPLKLSRSQALLAAGFMAVIGIAAVAYSFAASSYSFWSTTVTPTKVAADTQASEVGLKFYPDSDGTIDAVRFYKATTNTGAHTGTLWSGTGQQLATVTFANETASGWQTAKFASPVKVTATTNYVISYHTNVGRYSIDNNYFSKSRDRGPLHAPINTSSNPNGVYTHSATSAFPTSGKQATNFWVDVVFTPAATTTPTPSPTPTPVVSPSPTPITGVTTCPLPAYPSLSCTGRPSTLGDTYTKVVGDGYTVTTDGTVIDNWHVAGTLVIHANNVTIKNSQIDKTVYNDDYANSSYAISDSSVGPSPIKDNNNNLTLTDTNGNPLCNEGGLPSLNGHNITATRVYLYGNQDGVDMGGDNVDVRDSLLQPCFLPASIVGSDGYHSDGVQDQCSTTCSNITLTHNTIDARAVYNKTPTGNSALNLGSKADGLHLRTVSLVNNLFLGGGYTTALQWDSGNTWSVFGNDWVSKSWAFDASSSENTCSNQNWSDNSIVTVDANFNVTGTLTALPCVN